MASPSASPTMPEVSLSGYLREIRKFPMLSHEEECSLATRWRDHQELEAAHKLVTSHLGLVAKIAMGYRGCGLPLPELISEGNIGMMRAVRRYDPDRGFRFATCAVWWIRAAIQEYILHSWSLVKLGNTPSQKKLFFNLRKLKRRLQVIDDGDLSREHVTKIAAELAVPEADVVSMNRLLSAHDDSLNAPLRADGDGEWQDRLVDERDSQEARLGDEQELGWRRDLLRQAMTRLGEREKYILMERRLKENPSTLKELAQKYGISHERVRQIEVRAFRDVRKAIKSAGERRKVRGDGVGA
jgi:RNA polymerase sigma-32 factor